jgi:hypothetical protein
VVDDGCSIQQLCTAIQAPFHRWGAVFQQMPTKNHHCSRREKLRPVQKVPTKRLRQRDNAEDCSQRENSLIHFWLAISRQTKAQVRHFSAGTNPIPSGKARVK